MLGWNTLDVVLIAVRIGPTWKRKRRGRSGNHRVGRYYLKSSTHVAEPVTALFPPQVRNWALPSEAALTPKAAERVAREATTQTPDKAAEALNQDWGTRWDGRQIDRWVQRFGARLDAEHAAEVAASESGHRPAPPENAPVLLVVGPDGGRVQMKEKDVETGSRWREDKVLTVTSYLPGDGKEKMPEPLVTTHVASMAKTEEFGRLARVEMDRRGYHSAAQVLAIADCGNWIDPLLERECPGVERIADWCHAEEHLYASGRAVCGGKDTPAAKACAEVWADLLWEGKVTIVIAQLTVRAQEAGPPQKQDGPDHPRRTLAQNVGYFTKNQAHMKYPEYRAKGWPIGSGNTEAGVKQFNKRVKGTEQFWLREGVEPILALRSLWISQDERWEKHWANRPAYVN